jgi:hypothetical protein
MSRDALVRGAGIGEARSRGPACGDATVEPIMSASLPILRASPGSDPLGGPSSALRRAPLAEMRGRARWSVEQGPRLLGMRPRKRVRSPAALNQRSIARSRVAPPGQAGRHCSAVRGRIRPTADAVRIEFVTGCRRRSA